MTTTPTRRALVLTTAGAVVAGALALPASASAPASPAAGPSTAQAGGALPRYEVAVAVSESPDASTIGRRINEHGDFTGWGGWPATAYVWTDEDGYQVLPGVDGDQHRAGFDINDAGVVVGQSGRQTIEPPHQAAHWIDGVPEDIGSLEPGGDTEANGVNEAGTVVGWSAAGFYTHAFVWTDDAGMQDISGSGFGFATDVNEEGQVTGDQGSRAFVWEAGTMTFLEQVADYPYSFGRAINDAGQVVGSVKNVTGNGTRLARWTPGVGVEILGGGGQGNTMLGINNHGTSVGESRQGSYLRGVIHSDDFGLRLLNDLVLTDEWDIVAGYDVNDAGQVLANAFERSTGLMHALRLDPVRTMHDQGLRVTVEDADAPTAVATLRVLDADGNPVRRATLVGAWYDAGELVVGDATDRTNRRGRATITQDLAGFGPPDGVEFCVVDVTHRRFVYVPGDDGPPPCAGAG